MKNIFKHAEPMSTTTVLYRYTSKIEEFGIGCLSKVFGEGDSRYYYAVYSNIFKSASRKRGLMYSTWIDS